MAHVTIEPTKPVKADRAFDALEYAALRAEGKHSSGVDAATLDDVRAAVEVDRFRVRQCLDRVIIADGAEEGLDALAETGCLQVVFPEVHAMIGFGDGEWRHKDVWKHTKQVVRQAESRLEIRWSALFHDIGKIKTRSIAPDGTVHFLGHAEVGTRMFDKLERRLAFFSRSEDEALRRTVRFLILHHLRANQYDRGWTDSAVRRFAREMGPHLHDLFCLSRADITTKRPEKKRRGLSQLDELQARIAELAIEDAKQPPLPSGVGNAIMAAFGLRPSRRVGEIKLELERAIERGSLEERMPSAAYVLFAYEHAADFGLLASEANLVAIEAARHEVASAGFDARFDADAPVPETLEDTCGA
jgi:poly(A) polymerase